MTSERLRKTGLWFVAFVLSWTLAGYGQATTGSFLGTITDSTGAALPGATLVIQNQDTGVSRTVQSDEAGRYSARALNPGNYQITASLDGFQSAVHSRLTLTLGQEAVVNFQLPVGAVAQTVEVVGEAPLVETTQSSVDFLVNSATVSELPLNGRDLNQLILLNPGVALVDNGRGSTLQFGYGKFIAFSGYRPQNNLMLLDGTEVNNYNNLPPSGPSGGLFGAETIREFVVKSNGFSAAYGRALGGVVNAVTKSGTNAFHGSLFEFLRNDALDAPGYFDGGVKRPFRRNQFGGSFGGPIRHDRTFFFAAYEGLRQSRTDTSITFVPDANLRQGLFPGVSPSQVVPITLQYLAQYPLPNGGPVGPGIAQHFFSGKSTARDDVGTGRIDHQLSASDSLFGRATHSNSKTTDISLGDLGSILEMRARLLTVSETHIFSPQALNTFRFGYNRTLPISRGTYPAWPANLISNPEANVPPRISPGGGLTALAAPGATSPRLEIGTKRFEYIDDVTLSQGSHSLQFGANFQRVHNDLDFPNFVMGNWTFNSIPNFLTAQAQTFRGTPSRFGDFLRNFRQNFIGLYIQDDWKAASSLTLNVGVRYDLWTVPTETHGRIANLRNITDPTITRGGSLFENDNKHDFSPRIGFAWSPFSNGQTSVRGGFGIYYQRIDANSFWVPLLRDGLISPDLQFPNPRFFPNAIAAIQAATPVAVNPNAFQYRGVKTPHSQSWNLNLQRQFGASTVVSAGYVGNRGLDLSYQAQGNMPRPVLVNGFWTIPDGATLPNPNFPSIVYNGTGVKSWYNALEVNVQKRMADGLQFQVAYTYSKIITQNDTGSRGEQVAVNGDGGVLRNIYDFDQGKALAGYDVRNSLTANYLYELPFGRGKRWLSQPGVLSHVLGGWQLNGIVTLKDGQPFSIIGGGVPPALNVLNVTVLPNVNPAFSGPVIFGPPNKSKDPTGRQRYFDPNAFALPGPRQIGNVGRNTLTSPGTANWDLGLTRNFNLREIAQLQFRSEFFNVLNRPTFAAPNSSIFTGPGARNPTAGIITSTLGTSSREIQFGLKLLF
jgi:outer membrane receptor protein involved in Fe transport